MIHATSPGENPMDMIKKAISSYGFDLTDQKRIILYLDDLEQNARYDHLTGLLNRKPFMDLVNDEISKSLRYGTRSCIAMSDADHFKPFNDDYGHQTGDRVLKDLATLYMELIREGDKAGRYGGEEFVILFPNMDKPLGMKKCDDIRKRVPEELTYKLENTRTKNTENAQVTVSMGVSETGDILPENMMLRGKSGHRNILIPFLNGKSVSAELPDYVSLVNKGDRHIRKERFEQALESIKRIGEEYAASHKSGLGDLMKFENMRRGLGSFIWIKASDEAMYKAKEKGRNIVVAYDDF